jgi:hypothetical protein
MLRIAVQATRRRGRVSKGEISYGPGPSSDTVRAADGKVLSVPNDWSLLPPGDAALTRRVKLAGPHWLVQQRRGRRLFSVGLFAPTVTIDRLRGELEQERSSEAYAKRRVADGQRRERVQQRYVEDFTAAVLDFLNFHPHHRRLAERLAVAVSEHATPVGSGTVARTERIPIQQRAESAVIAWMRHQTTGYDSMRIPRVKGMRREVRRQLAQRSKELLWRYRQGEPVSGGSCPLQTALDMPLAERRG